MAVALTWLVAGCQPPRTAATDCQLVANTAMCETYYPPGFSCPRPKARPDSHEWEVAKDLVDRLGVKQYSSYFEACKRIDGDGP